MSARTPNRDEGVCPSWYGKDRSPQPSEELVRGRATSRTCVGKWVWVAWMLIGLLALGMNSAMALTTTTTTLTSSVNPSFVNQNTTLTAQVSPAAAAGTVTFKDGTTTLGTATLILMSVQDDTNYGMLSVVTDDWRNAWQDLDR
jgi:multisubunit Na+/H+ antiporter MnhE subunit